VGGPLVGPPAVANQRVLARTAPDLPRNVSTVSMFHRADRDLDARTPLRLARSDLLSPHYQAPEKPTERSKGRSDNPDATHFSRLAPEVQDRISKQIAKGSPPELGALNMGRMVDNIKSMYREALATNPSAVEEGSHWYNDAHHFARHLSETHGVPLRHSIGMLAALSPQAHWEENKTLASYFHHHLSASPAHPDGQLQLSPEQLRRAHADIDANSRRTKGPAMRLTPGKSFADMDPEEAAQSLKAQAKYHHDLKVPGRLKKDGDPWRATFSTGTGSMAKAVRIHRGEDPDDVLGGHKVRSFFNNISDPDNEEGRDSVTMDTHAVSLASGAKFGASSKELGSLFDTGSQKEPNIQGTYAYFADAYRKAHQDLQDSGEMSPQSHVHHLQASTWLHWRAITDDEGPLKEANKGRFLAFSGPAQQNTTNREKANTRQRALDKTGMLSWGRTTSFNDPGDLLDPGDYEGPDPDFDPRAGQEAEAAAWEAEPEEMARNSSEADPDDAFDAASDRRYEAALGESPSVDCYTAGFFDGISKGAQGPFRNHLTGADLSAYDQGLKAGLALHFENTSASGAPRTAAQAPSASQSPADPRRSQGPGQRVSRADDAAWAAWEAHRQAWSDDDIWGGPPTIQRQAFGGGGMMGPEQAVDPEDYTALDPGDLPTNPYLEPGDPDDWRSPGPGEDAPPSSAWNWQHDPNDDPPNPASMAAPNFGHALDPRAYPFQDNQDLPDEQLLAPGPAITNAWGGVVAARRHALSAAADLPSIEASELISEGEGLLASNLEHLAIEGTSYADEVPDEPDDTLFL